MTLLTYFLTGFFFGIMVYVFSKAFKAKQEAISMKMKNPHRGSSFDSWVKDEGLELN